MKIFILGIDPAIRAFGYAQGWYDTNQNQIFVHTIALVTTEKDTKKTIRRNSDDFRRAQHHQRNMVKYCAGMAMAMVELPVGTQSARGAMSNGICLGVMASCPIPVIQLNPDEVKMAAVGHKQAAKEEMIEWAHAKYPELPWLTQRRKGNLELINANEHLADAVAVIHAGVLTEQFNQARAMMNAMAA